MSLRIFFIGGWMSYRALFGWLSPWILVPIFIIDPIFQIIFFAYMGRAADYQSDEFFLIGNAIIAAATPCLFAMGNTIGGERDFQTLGLLLASPARRIPLFLGRALPVILNGIVLAMFALVVGSIVLRVNLAPGSIPLLAVAIAVSAYACTGLGLVTAALALRVRETAVLDNIVFGLLLVFCGVNVALGTLPGWMAAIGEALPLTHGIAASREIADGASWAQVADLVATEAAIGTLYVLIGLIMLRVFEIESRRRATLELA
jgi:ABC-2 type transport system permease protein